MARLYSTLRSFKRRDRKEIEKDLTSLDVAILTRAGIKGADYYEILNACRPYIGRSGVKFFASSEQVRTRIKILKQKDLLEIG